MNDFRAQLELGTVSQSGVRESSVYCIVRMMIAVADLPSLSHLAGDSHILEPSPAHPPHH